MGLFDFVKDVGEKVFHTDGEAADNIKEYVEIRTSGVKNLDVEFDDGCATLKGECINEATRESAILVAGNVEGVEKVVADELTAPPPPPEKPQPKVEYYTIEKGDTLGEIAQRFYGKASEYQRIFEDNRDVISDPDKIYPGQKIRIVLENA
jgi:nucleoid-associated protein YgaU